LLNRCYVCSLTAFEVDVRGTFNVFGNSKEKWCKKTIFSSTASVYGKIIHSLKITLLY